MSKSVVLKEKYTIRERIKYRTEEIYFIVVNPSDSIGFAGLSVNPCRIIILEPDFVICVQDKYILAHTNKADLISENNKSRYQTFLRLKILSDCFKK